MVSLLRSVQTYLRAHPVSYPINTGGSFPGGKAAGAPVPWQQLVELYFLAWSSVKHRDKHIVGFFWPRCRTSTGLHGVTFYSIAPSMATAVGPSNPKFYYSTSFQIKLKSEVVCRQVNASFKYGKFLPRECETYGITPS
jgi:hypothetical protein